MAQSPDAYAPPVIAPRRCAQCGGRAYVTRRSPLPDGPAGRERRTFQCSACDWQIELVASLSDGDPDGPGTATL